MNHSEFIKNKNKIEIEKYEYQEWQFEFNKSILTHSYEISQLGDKLKLQSVPEILFNDNEVNLKHKNIEIKINCQDCLRLCNFEMLEEYYLKEDINKVYLKPSEIHLKQYAQWKEKIEEKMLENPDIKIINRISDPFFSSPFMGTLKEKELKIVIEESDQGIPLDRLGQENPIIWGNHISLFEDELGDNGQVSLEFRFRTMKDCWFGLLRSYLRVDDVIVRIYDTRFFCDYSTNYILREFTAKESNYQNIQKKGFNFSPSWTSSQGQSFTIQDYLDVIFVKRHKIYYKP